MVLVVLNFYLFIFLNLVLMDYCFIIKIFIFIYDNGFIMEYILIECYYIVFMKYWYFKKVKSL